MRFPRLIFTCINIVLALSVFQNDLSAQSKFFTPADTLSKGRFWGSLGTTALGYTGTVIGLNEIWYKDFERSPFHTFNDWNEWENMDKAGHIFSAYMFTSVSYQVGRWTGLKKKGALWLGCTLGTVFQTTIEVLDAYSEKWGFSIYDIAANTSGVILFAGQEMLWDDQRIILKVSNRFPKYAKTALRSKDGSAESSAYERATKLFGSAPTTKFIKDYNGQTIWLSVNPASFFPDSKLPKWLNFSFGYGAENLYGGFANSWTYEDKNYALDPIANPRGNQLFLSFDIDLKRLPVKKPFWRFILKGLNLLKIPSPTLSFTKNQGAKFHALYW